MNTAYEKGRSAEYHVKRLLEQKGYIHLIRSYASRTPIDIFASNGNEVLAVQVKQGGYISQKGKERLLEWASKFHARACLARKRRGRWVVISLNSA